MLKMENVKLGKENGNINMKNALIGSIISMVISIVLLLIFSVILVNTNIKESTIKPVVIIITAISILIGSSITTIKIKKNGILNGGIIGGLYIAVIYLLSSIAITGFGLNIDSIIIMIAAILTGMLGRNNRSKYKMKCKFRKYDKNITFFAKNC